MGQHMVESIQLKSPAFRDNGEIPEQYTCDGDNVNPPLQLFSPNIETRSFVLIMEDPDIKDGPFTHWIMWNIDIHTSEIEEDTVPVTAVQGMNSFNRIGYAGPRPGLWERRYKFHLYGLDTFLALPEGAPRQELEEALQGHILEKTTLVGRYQHHGKRQSKERKLL